jgi:SAM-dependent methyltransferase
MALLARRVAQFAWKFCAGTAQQRQDARYQLAMQLRGIDLRWTSVDELGLNGDRAESQGNSGGPGLESVLKHLTISPADAILDIGCGKGGAMITLAKWPFERVDGIEISPAMIQIAQRNLEKLGRVRGAIMQRDAAEFQDLDTYTYYYMYNPFTELVMRPLLENIRASVRRAPRKVTIVYKNPVCHNLLISAGFRHTATFDHTIPPFRIYDLSPDGHMAFQ